MTHSAFALLHPGVQRWLYEQRWTCAGTPTALAAGNVLECAISGLGALNNRIVAADGGAKVDRHLSPSTAPGMWLQVVKGGCPVSQSSSRRGRWELVEAR